jgi:predicted enzyme related to lactoylglutathione lyase
MDVLINIDVTDLERALAFYSEAFDLTLRRRFGERRAELAGWPVSLFLPEKPAGSNGAGESLRTCERHWTPGHLDIVVEDIDNSAKRRGWPCQARPSRS